jgi:hypothetical protein
MCVRSSSTSRWPRASCSARASMLWGPRGSTRLRSRAGQCDWGGRFLRTPQILMVHNARAPAHICAGTGLAPAHICTGTGLAAPTSAPGLAWNLKLQVRDFGEEPVPLGRPRLRRPTPLLRLLAHAKLRTALAAQTRGQRRLPQLVVRRHQSSPKLVAAYTRHDGEWFHARSRRKGVGGVSPVPAQMWGGPSWSLCRRSRDARMRT